MFAEKVFYSSWGHCKNGKCFGPIKLDVLDWWRYGKFRVWCWNKSVKILEKFFSGDFEGQVSTNNFQRMIFCISISFFLLRSQLCTSMELTFLGSLFDFILIDLLRFLILLFVFLFLLFLILLNISTILLLIDDSLPRLLRSLISN